jgi:hypothetical protein
VAAGIAIAVGSLLPWAEVLGVTERGVATVDGWFTLTSGCILAAIGLARPRVSVPGYVAWVATLNGAGLWTINYFDIRATEGLSVGIGLWITLAGLVLALVSLLIGHKEGLSATWKSAER